MSLLGNPKITKSGVERVLTADLKSEDLLNQILIELKINNAYLLQIVGDANKISESDIGE